MLKRPAIWFASLLLAAVFVLGLARLFELRLGRGDLYPAYSTLRTDPLGSSVLYESLDRVPGVSAQRYFEETFKSDEGPARALFVLGAQPYSADQMLSRSEFDTLQRFVYNGGRVVIAYYPVVGDPSSRGYQETNETGEIFPDGRGAHRHRRHAVEQPAADGSETNHPSPPHSLIATNLVSATNAAATPWRLSPRQVRRNRNAQKGQGQPDQQDQQEQQDEKELNEGLNKYADLSQQWGFQFHYHPLDTNEDGKVEFPLAARVAPLPALPAVLAIHTSVCFTNLTNGWTTVYQRGQQTPVVIERKFGAGSVALVADAYPFSNEAMFKDRAAPLLAWLLGSGRDAIFDEAHLGIVERPGMATLMRRYQLHGLIFSLLLVAGLFVWKNCLSLVPPHLETTAGAGPVVAGRDSASGLVNLLRRGVAPAEIINLCYAEWKKSNARLAALSPAQRRDLEQLIQQQAALEPRLRKPVENYRVICRILQRRPGNL